MNSDSARAERFLRHLEPLQGAMEAYCRQSLHDPESVEDTLQNALADAFRNFHLYVENTNFRAWIFRYLNLEVLEQNRRTAKGRTQETLSAELLVAGDSGTPPSERLLRLEPGVVLYPAETVPLPVTLVSTETPLAELIAQGLGRRPELARQRALVAEAQTRLRLEQWRPWVPNLQLGNSGGGYGGGPNSFFGDFEGRNDPIAFSAVISWANPLMMERAPMPAMTVAHGVFGVVLGLVWLGLTRRRVAACSRGRAGAAFDARRGMRFAWRQLFTLVRVAGRLQRRMRGA